MARDERIIFDVFCVVLRQFREEVDPLFNFTYKYHHFLYLYNVDFRKDRIKLAKRMNCINIRGGRQRSRNAIVHNMEEDLVDLLIQFYPANAIQVKKYLRLAGYSDKELPDLLNRTVGQVYLYNGLPKRRN